MKVVVCGGRNFRSPALVFREFDRLHAELMQKQGLLSRNFSPPRVGAA
jgi:hypothetical protein